MRLHTHHAGPEPVSGLVTANRALTAALFGGQLVWLTTAVPAYRRLTTPEYLKVHTLLTWYGDLVMPVVGLSATLSGHLRYRRDGRVRALAGTAALVAAGIAALPNLQINARLRELHAAGTVDADVRRDRARWAVNHGIRTAGGLIACAAFLPDATRAIGLGRPRQGAPAGWLDAVIGLVMLAGGREVAQHAAAMAVQRSDGTKRAVRRLYAR